MRRINDVLTAQPALDELAEFVGLLVEETLRPEVTVVALYDTDDESLSYPFASESGERVSQPTSALARDSVSAVIRDRTIVRNVDGSFLGVPIRAGDEAIGVLAVESPGATRFDEADAHLLAAIAVGIAPTIRSAHLLRALRDIRASLPAAGRGDPGRHVPSLGGRTEQLRIHEPARGRDVRLPARGLVGSGLLQPRPPPRRSRLGACGERSAADGRRQHLGQRLPHAHCRRAHDLDPRRVVDGSRRERKRSNSSRVA